MTARDSYSPRRSVAGAVTELQRVAGTQLDARFVERFVELLENRGVAFHHADDADFEAELAVEHSFSAG
jgi:HD-GYP domain-containing protein (c-di-GMP phosphodiesterase class II)